MGRIRVTIAIITFIALVIGSTPLIDQPAVSANGEGSISGSVTDGTNPVEGATIYVYESIGPTWGPIGEPLGWVSTGASGNYIFPGLPTGEYLVRVEADGYASQWYGSTIYWRELTLVPVTAPDETTGIDFTLVEPGSSILGNVSDGVSPIEGAYVMIFDASVAAKGICHVVWTDASGNYQTGGLPVGQYRVAVIAESYAREWYDSSYTSAGATPVPVTPPDDTTGIDFVLEPGGTISGNVSDGTNPVAGAVLFTWDYDSLFTGAWVLYDVVTTDVDGNFITNGHPDGTYGVQVQATGYVTEWYDDVYNQDNAEPVPVTVPDDTPDIDFVLELGGTISGQVIDSVTLDPITNLHVYALNSTAGEWTAGINTDTEGNYTLVVPTGSYKVSTCVQCTGTHEPYINEWYNSALTWNEATPVPVTAPGNTGGIDFSLELGGTISGNVTDGTNPIEGANIQIIVYDTILSYGVHVGGAQTDSDGYYITNGLPNGRYGVRVEAAGFASEWYDGTYYREEAEAVEITAPGNIGDIDFNLEPSGNISGRVIDSVTLEPVANFHVNTDDYDNNMWVAGVNTNADGYYVLSGLPEGNYRVKTCVHCTGTHDPYINEYYDSVYTWNEAEPVPVTAHGNTGGIDFSLELGGTISGNVTDGSNPIEGAWIDVFDYDSLSGEWASYGGTQTDADGNYVTDGLPTGTYGVQVRAAGYATEWYDDVFNQNNAEPVPVTVPGNTPDINFSLEPGGSISGVVRNADGSATLAYVSVEANRVDGSGGIGVTTNQNGVYTVSGLPYGDYHVCSPSRGRWGAGDNGYITEYWQECSGPPLPTPIITIDSGKPDWTDINFTLEIGGSISGNVSYLDNSTPTPIPNLRMHARDPDTFNVISATDTDADGNYTLPALSTGSYIIEACASCSGLSYINEYYDDVYNQNDAEPVPVTAPNDTPDINFSLNPAGTISGHVSDGTNPIQGARIEIYDYNSLSGGWIGYGSAQTDADGYFVIGGLPTGTYAVRAQAVGYATEWYEDTQCKDGATPVSMIAPGNVSIDFSLEPGGSISGVVKSADGLTTLANVSVQCQRPVECPNDWYIAFTDSEGNYTINSLPYGDYEVASPAWGRMGSGDDNYVMEFYNNQASAEEADLVTVNGATPNRTDIDFTLAVGGSISGNVSYFDNTTPTPIVNLRVHAKDPDTYYHIAGTSTDTDGNYTLAGLPAGSYVIEACATCSGLNYVNEWYDDVYLHHDATPVSVNVSEDTPNINFILEIGGTISGKVINSSTLEPIANLHVNATDNETLKWTAGSNTDVEGRYTLVVPTGSYLVRACASCSGLNYIEEWYDDVYNPNDAKPVTVTAPNNTPNINFILDPGGTITGRVLDSATLDPIANLHVYAVDSGTGQWKTGNNTDSGGYYTLLGLPTGNYIIGTCAPCSGLNYYDEWYDDAHNPNDAEPVLVTAPGNTPNIHFILDHIICGDVNIDRNVNMGDVMILWYDLAEYPTEGKWTISNEWAADVNCDSKINMGDVMILWYDLADYPSPGEWEVSCCED